MGNQIKRTTLMVRDMDRSLEFFKDVLGAKVWFDRPYTLSGTGIPIGKKGDLIRLCIVQFEHDTIGMVGMMEFKDPVMPAPEVNYELGYGRPVFVVVADVRRSTLSLSIFGMETVTFLNVTKSRILIGLKVRNLHEQNESSMAYCSAAIWDAQDE